MLNIRNASFAALAFTMAIATSASASTMSDDCGIVKNAGKKSEQEIVYEAAPVSDVVCFDGNDDASVLNNYNGGDGLFDLTGWTFGHKNESGPEPGSLVSFSQNGTPVNGTTSGTWAIESTIDDFLDNYAVALVLKGDNSFGAFLLAGMSGDWSIIKNQNGDTSGKDLSHATLYYTELDVTQQEVPLPAGLPLLLAGLGGFAYIRSRQKAKA